MVTSLRFFLVVAFILIAAVSAPLAAQTMAGGKNGQIMSEELMEKFRDAWRRDDSTSVRAGFSSDVVLVGPDRNMRGKKAIDSWAGKQMAGTGEMKITTLQADMSGNIAFHAGRWSLEVIGQDGKMVTKTGSYLFTWRKESSGWKISAIMISDDPPAKK